MEDYYKKSLWFRELYGEEKTTDNIDRQIEKYNIMIQAGFSTEILEKKKRELNIKKEEILKNGTDRVLSEIPVEKYDIYDKILESILQIKDNVHPVTWQNLDAAWEYLYLAYRKKDKRAKEEIIKLTSSKDPYVIKHCFLAEMYVNHCIIKKDGELYLKKIPRDVIRRLSVGFENEATIQFNLGLYFDILKDTGYAFIFYKNAALLNVNITKNSEELWKRFLFARLGICYAEGVVTPVNKEKSIEYFGMADIESLYLGKGYPRYIAGKLLCKTQDRKLYLRGIQLLEHSTSEGQFLAAKEYFYGNVTGVPDYEKTVKNIRIVSSESYYIKGKMYENGYYYKRNINEARGFYVYGNHMHFKNPIKDPFNGNCREVIRLYHAGEKIDIYAYMQALYCSGTDKSLYEMIKIYLSDPKKFDEDKSYNFIGEPYDVLKNIGSFKDKNYYLFISYPLKMKRTGKELDRELFDKLYESLCDSESPSRIQTKELLIKVGDFLTENDYFPKDIGIWYIEAGKAGLYEGYIKAGHFYYNGLNTNDNGKRKIANDFLKAGECYKCAYLINKNEESGYYYAKCLGYGYGVPKNKDKAIEILEENFSGGHAPSGALLADLYSDRLTKKYQKNSDIKQETDILKVLFLNLNRYIKEGLFFSDSDIMLIKRAIFRCLRYNIYYFAEKQIYAVTNEKTTLFKISSVNGQVPDIDYYIPVDLWKYIPDSFQKDLYDDALRAEESGNELTAITLYYYSAYLGNRKALYTLINMSMEETQYFITE